jgi:hypothetical protein
MSKTFIDFYMIASIRCMHLALYEIFSSALLLPLNTQQC